MDTYTGWKQRGMALNALIEKYMFVIVPASLMLGFLFYSRMQYWVDAIPWMFAYLTFVMAYGCGAQEMREALRKPKAMLVVFILTHVAAPLIAYGFGCMLYGADSPFTVGFVLLTAIPLGVSSVMWIGISSGYVALTLAMIVFDSLLSPLIIPLMITAFFGETVQLDYMPIVQDLLLIIVLPTILGIAVNQLTKGRAKPVLAPIAGPTSKLAFIGVVMINAAAISPYVVEFKEQLPRMIGVIVILVIICYALGYIGSFVFGMKEMLVTFSFSSGMRNISLGLVLALGYFSPQTAVPVVLAILIQQPMATLNHAILKRVHRYETE